MHPLAQLDHAFVWHPFTQMREWLRREPIVITSGRGSLLCDVRGRRFLDANASIWTNLHGHNHPRINRAIKAQLRKIAHSSALGLANEPASRLAERLIHEANVSVTSAKARRLAKVFYSDDGSTALEVALKLAYEYARRTGHGGRPRFLSLQGAYHGDTVGAVSLGHIDLFHRAYRGLLFATDAVMAPYCYRCPFNRAQPERADARDYRQCRWECVTHVERAFERQRRRGKPYAALVVEPLIQGAAGMIPQPAGWLRRVAEIARAHRAQLIADEVLTGFGRTGIGMGVDTGRKRRGASLFACHQEGVQPDFMALAKGITGGYLPLAVTLVTREVFDVFLGDYGEFKTFFHGHSYTANQLGCAAALASLELLTPAPARQKRLDLEVLLQKCLAALWSLPAVGDIRQVGLVAGIELVRDWRTRAPFDLRERVGVRVTEAMARRGVLTRPIGNVLVLMPPYCTTPVQLRRMVRAMAEAIEETVPLSGYGCG
jgi:adenosylmethionine-8-amino-7-oxononanoate aminotransferase